ncbi:MAG: hypothetical protein HKN78_08765 [Sphingomonadaceae bacterium]|nr:hypothetical protein [Sphingomonadaceae bacterium]
MTNDFNIRKNLVAAVAAFAISSTVILGTIGPVEAGTTSAQLHLLAEQGASETPSVLIA